MQRPRVFEVRPCLYNEKTRKLEYPFFEGTSLKFVETIGEMLERETFEKQDYIFKDGEVGFSMYFVTSGSIIMANSLALDEVTILSRGQHCGELALFGASRRTASAIARERTVCLVLKNRVFQAVLERFPEEKQHFAQMAVRKKRAVRITRNVRPATFRIKKGEDSDSDRDATDDPAPKMPSDEAAPLPDTEIPGAYPTTRKLNILEIRAPPRHGPEQLPPMKRYTARMGRELASVGRSAFMRKMAVAEEVCKDMAALAPASSNSLRPQSALPREKTLEMKRPVKTVEEDDDGFDLNFDLKQLEGLQAIDPWRRAVSA